MGYNVLIVDDSSVVRKVLIKTFGMTDIEVNTFHQASNGKEALELLKSNWVDLVFLDINMPVMNGMEFMKQLKSDPQIADTPVVVVSTEGSKERIDELYASGIKAFLRKPTTPESLVDTIVKVLGEIKHER
ncbi:MAG: response regulator [Oligoflexia bacterium]|nr:response regulator [Oligoflexia bacterium]